MQQGPCDSTTSTSCVFRAEQWPHSVTEKTKQSKKRPASGQQEVNTVHNRTFKFGPMVATSVGLSGTAVWSTHRGHLLGSSPEIFSKVNILLSTAGDPSSRGLHVFSKSSELSCISFLNQHEMSYDRPSLDGLWEKGLDSGVRHSPTTAQENRGLALIELGKLSQNLSVTSTLQYPSGLTTAPLGLMWTPWTWNMLVFHFS